VDFPNSKRNSSSIGRRGTENRAALARAVLDDATKKAAEIVTSTLAFSEVNRPSVAHDGVAGSVDKLAEFFENDFIVLVMLDRNVGELARTLMQRQYPGLKPLDAVHLASALVANVDEMHSFDERLLDLSDRIDKKNGKPLKICKPSMGGPLLPLLDAPSDTAHTKSEEDGEP
jgi:predicted nucleic acid-binding protein